MSDCCVLEELPQDEGGLESGEERVESEGRVGSEEGKVRSEEGRVRREEEERWWSLVLRYRHFRLPRIETLLQHCIQLLGFYGTHYILHTSHPHMHTLTCTPSRAHRFTACSPGPSVGGIPKLRPPQEGAADTTKPRPHRSGRKGVCLWEREGTKVTQCLVLLTPPTFLVIVSQLPVLTCLTCLHKRHGCHG